MIFANYTLFYVKDALSDFNLLQTDYFYPFSRTWMDGSL